VDKDHEQCRRAEQDGITPRPVYTVTPERPGADAMAIAAAAFAASAVALRNVPDASDRASKCILHAKVLFKYAKKFPGCYSASIPECGKTYANDNWEQFMFFAAAWLFICTEEQTYRRVRTRSDTACSVIQRRASS
jgi:endoglucanase